MNKITLDTFIQKYNLGGSINSVKWESNGDTLSTRFISPDKSLLGELSLSKQSIPKPLPKSTTVSFFRIFANVIGEPQPTPKFASFTSSSSDVV